MGDWDTPPTAGELAAVKDPWATPPTPEEMRGHGPTPEQPSLARRVLTWATTPSAGMQDIQDERRRIVSTQPPGLLRKDSGDVLAGATRFLSGAMPGSNENPAPPETAERLQRFDQDHPAISVGLGLVGGGLNPILPSGEVPAAAAPNAIGRLANSVAARTLRGTAGEYRALGEEGVQRAGDFLLRNKAVRFGSTPAAVAERVATLPEQTGKALGGAIEGLDATGAQVSKRALAQNFQQLAEEAKGGGPGAAPLVAKYEQAATDVLKDIQTTGEPMMSFKQAEEWKRAYQAPINYAKATNTPLEMGSKELASAARQGVEDAAGAVGEGSPLAEQFLRAKEESGLAQQTAKMAEGADGRRMGRNMSSPTARAASIMGVIGAVASGHPGAAIPALVAGPALEEVLKRSPSAAAVLLKGLSKGPGPGRVALQTPAEAIFMRLLRNRGQLPAEVAQNEQ